MKKFDHVFMVFIIAASIVLISRQVFFEPIIGLSDNGDFIRIRAWFGLDPKLDAYQGFVVEEFSFKQLTPSDYYSSELIFTQLAISASRLFRGTEYFHLRFLGGVHFLFYITGVILLIYALRQAGRITFYLTSMLNMLIFTDVRTVQYFNSFYNEPAAFISILFCMSMFLFCLKPIDIKKWSVCFFLYIFWGIILSSSKNLNIPTAIIFGCLGILLVYQRFGLRDRRSWLFYLSTGIIFVVCATFPMLMIKNYARANLFNSIFNGTLLNSKNPEQDLAELNINHLEFKKYIGQSFWFIPKETRYSPEFTAAFDEHVMERTGYLQIIQFYFNHPDRFFQFVKTAINNSQLEDPELGNFTEASGYPGRSNSKWFNAWSSFRRLDFWRSAKANLAIVMIMLFIAGYIAFRTKDSAERYRALLLLALVIACYIQIAAVIIGDGLFELVKHLVGFNFLSDLCLILFLALLIPRMGPVYSRLWEFFKSEPFAQVLK